MRRGRLGRAGQGRHTLIAGCTLAAALLGSATAHAADRGFELVTPPGSQASTLRFHLADPDGDWVYYVPTHGSEPLDIRPDTGAADGFGAQRTGSGWQNHWLTPVCPGDPNVNDGATCTSPFEQGISTAIIGGNDGEIVFATNDDIATNDSNFSSDLYRSDVDGATLVSEGASGAAGNIFYDGAAVSADGSTVAFSAFDQLLPSDQDDSADIYVSRAGSLVQASGVAGCTTGCGGVEAPDHNRRAVSENGDRVTFVTSRQIDAVEDTDGQADLYVNDADGTRLLSPDTPAQVDYAFSTPDGHRAYWTTSAAVLPAEDTDTAVDVYVTDVSTGVVSLVSVGGSADVESRAAAASADGSLAVFATAEQIAGSGAPADGSLKLYASEGDIATYIASLDDANDPIAPPAGAAPGPIAVADDGSSAVFSTASSLLGTDGNGAQDVYRWTPTGGLALLSPRPAGEEAGDVRFRSPVLDPGPQGPGGPAARFGPGMTADGASVFFDSDAALVPADADSGFTDVYEWSAGEGLRLLTPAGAAPFDSRYTFNTADGRDVFLESEESITGWDTDAGEMDVYVARVGGGFPEPSSGVDHGVGAPTGGGGPAGAPPAPKPSTTAPWPVEPVAPQPPDDQGGAGPVGTDAQATVDGRRFTRSGRAVRVGYSVTGEGTLRVRLVSRRGGRLFARGSRSVQEGDTTVRLRLTRAGRRALSEGRVRAMLVTRFAPEGGAASRTRTRVVVQSEDQR